LKRKIACLVLLLILAACANKLPADAVNLASSVKKGQTTLDDLEDLLGDDYSTISGTNSEFVLYELDKDELESGVLSARLVFEVKDDIIVRYFVDKSLECNDAKGIFCIQSRSAKAQKITFNK
jgi:hypothetical protein